MAKHRRKPTPSRTSRRATGSTKKRAGPSPNSRPDAQPKPRPKSAARTSANKRPPAPNSGDSDLINAVSRHVTKHLGKPETVLHEIVSDVVHIDIHVVKPTSKRKFWFLVTSGMAERPMNAPQIDGVDARFAELVIALPAYWKVDAESFKDERWFWPIRWLKILARFPHLADTWLFFGHTVDMSEHGAPGTGFTAALIGNESELPEKFYQLRIGKKLVHFMVPVPLYREECDFAVRNGIDALIDRLLTLSDSASDSYNPSRPNVCAKRR